MERLTACGFPSAQQLVCFVCYPKHVEALAALALSGAAKSCGRSHVLLASLGEQRVPVDPWKEEEGSRDRQCRESARHAYITAFHPGKQLCCCWLSSAAEV